MPFEPISSSTIHERMQAIGSLPYRHLIDESMRYANRQSQERKRRIRILEKNAETIDALMPEEPVGELERALKGTPAEELHERLSRTKSCLFIDRTRGASTHAICTGYASDLEIGTELLFATFSDQSVYIRAFHARTITGPSLFIDAIEGKNFAWKHIDEWNRGGWVSELMTSIAGATLLTREDERTVVFAEEEPRELAMLAGYAKHAVFEPDQTEKTHGRAQRSNQIHKPATHYPVVPREHLEPLTRAEIDAYSEQIYPHILRAPLQKRAIITSAYSTIINYASRIL